MNCGFHYVKNKETMMSKNTFYLGLLIFLPWMIKVLVEFTTRILTSIPGLVS